MEGSSLPPTLRLLEQHLRQQRALQQLSVVQHQNAWRPQRGLPERAVSILRAWLFENFLHPYPKDSDKLMLANQTGLTRNQVSNWFINARVRLWKPMIEEMYLEETKEQQTNDPSERTSKSNTNEDSTPKSIAPQEISPSRNHEQASSSNLNPMDTNVAKTSPQQPSLLPSNAQSQSCFSPMDSWVAGCGRDEGTDRASSRKKARTAAMSNEGEFYVKYSGGSSNAEDEYSLFIGNGSSHAGAFGGYHIGDLGRFDDQQFAPRVSGGGVSLTLGLPHCENLSLSRAQSSYLSSQSMPLGSDSNQFCSINTPAPAAHSTGMYEMSEMLN